MPKKAKERKGKKAHTKHKLKSKSEQYTVSETGVERKKSCPKCGSGVFLAVHANRQSCGKCGFTEFAKQEATATA
jgi:ubiquitin-small subunit ribosomal protein S27Ae